MSARLIYLAVKAQVERRYCFTIAMERPLSDLLRMQVAVSKADMSVPFRAPAQRLNLMGPLSARFLRRPLSYLSRDGIPRAKAVWFSVQVAAACLKRRQPVGYKSNWASV